MTSESVQNVQFFAGERLTPDMDFRFVGRLAFYDRFSVDLIAEAERSNQPI